MQSSVPGLPYPKWRDERLKTPFRFLEGRRAVDGAEGLWRVRNGLYDLEAFAKNHPGGPEWIRLTKGTDITEVFESHHVTDKAEKLLGKFYVRDASAPRSTPFTFRPNGFFHSFKRRVREVLKDVDFHRPSLKSNLIADLIVTLAVISCLLAAASQSYVAVLFAGVFLVWTTIIAHNYFHMRDNFRMYYFDLSTMSSKDWRISHVMSHHTYPNTFWDFEIYMVEPFVRYHPFKDKTFLGSLFGQVMSPVFWALGFFQQCIKRYYSVFFEYRSFEFRDAVPFFLPITMALFAPSVSAGLTMWALIITLASFLFSMIGLNAAHHHPNIFHDGDVYRDDLDWGLLELDAVREREVIDDNAFLVLTNFGLHGLHHLLPTVDHSYLPLCMKAFEETCAEFNVDLGRWTQWELMKGQFQQIARSEPKKNHR